jgi:hypothetical protein
MKSPESIATCNSFLYFKALVINKYYSKMFNFNCDGQKKGFIFFYFFYKVVLIFLSVKLICLSKLSNIIFLILFREIR